MADTINDVGNRDEMHILHEVERAFGIKLTDEEAGRVVTVGRRYDHLERKIERSIVSRFCLSPSALYRLRRAFASGWESMQRWRRGRSRKVGNSPHGRPTSPSRLRETRLRRG
jgi:hypothetical protein